MVNRLESLFVPDDTLKRPYPEESKKKSVDTVDIRELPLGSILKVRVSYYNAL